MLKKLDNIILRRKLMQNLRLLYYIMMVGSPEK